MHPIPNRCCNTYYSNSKGDKAGNRGHLRFNSTTKRITGLNFQFFSICQYGFTHRKPDLDTGG